jgi:hypothetical protein
MVNFPLLVFATMFVALTIAAKFGDVLRVRWRSVGEDNRDDSGIVLTGTLTLLGLIIGFSFSMAINRYDLRKDCERVEANAIAAEYMRADLLRAPDAGTIHELLRKYLDQRVSFYSTRNVDELRKIAGEGTRLQNELWTAIQAAIGPLPPQLQGFLISGMNDIVVSQRSTQASWWNRIPVAAWILIAVTSIGCNFLVGYRARRTDWLVFLVMPIAVSISLFLISDLDSPRGGAIRVAPQNLLSLSQSLRSS